MTDVNKIHETIKPLGDRLEAFYPEEGYYDLKDAKEIRLCTFSDVMLKVLLEFSYDNENKGIVGSHRSTSVWISSRHEVPMRFMRVHVINESQVTNENLIITCRCIPFSGSPPYPSIKKEIKEPSITLSEKVKEGSHISFSSSLYDRKGEVEILQPPVIEIKKDNDHKSPFSRFRKKTSITGEPIRGVKSVPVRDDRLPSYSAPFSILVSGVGNSYKALPKGLDGEFLMMKNGEPMWCLPFPPSSLSDESIKRLTDTMDTWKI